MRKFAICFGLLIMLILGIVISGCLVFFRPLVEPRAVLGLLVALAFTISWGLFSFNILYRMPYGNVDQL